MSKKKPKGGARKSAKAEGEEQAKHELDAERTWEEHPDAFHKRKSPRPGNLCCSTCGKQIQDVRTLKLHERNCRPIEKEGRPRLDPMLVAINDIKDAMAQERSEMLKFVAEREADMAEQLAAVKAAAEHQRTPIQPMHSPGQDMAYGERAPPWQEGGRWVPQTPIQQSLPVGPSMDDIRALIKAELKETLSTLEAQPKGLTEDEVKGIARREAEGAVTAARQPSASPADLAALEHALEVKLSALDARLLGQERKGANGEVDRVEAARINRLHKDLERLEWRVEQLMDEVGFGESLDVSKIPSNILEIVYQATLDDVVREMGKTRSTQEVGGSIESTLEEVRKNTSGSELFRYNGRRIITENLAKSIDQGLISAKQIQTTYAELLNKLLENVPAYKPKNFRAMIKIKSQEYAVDRVTHLLGRTDNLEKVMDNMGQMIAAFSAQSNARFNHMSSRLDEIAGPMMERKADTSQLEEARLAINDVRLAVAELAKDSSRLLAKLELGASLAPASVESEGGDVGAIATAGKVEMSEGERLIASLLEGGPLSVSSLRKKAEAFITPEDTKHALEELKEKGLVETKKWKKGTRIWLVTPPPEQSHGSETEGAKTVHEPTEHPSTDVVVYAPEADQSKPEDGEGNMASDVDARDGAINVVRGPDASHESAEGALLQAEPSTGSESGGAGTSSENKLPFKMSEIQRRVLGAIGDGATMPSLRKALEDVKYTDIMVAVRVLIDEGYVSAESHGRGTTYSRAKEIEPEEVKKDA